MFVTVEIKKSSEVCFHPWKNVFLNFANEVYLVISWRGIVRDSPTVVFSFENEYFFNRCCLSSTLKNIDEIQTSWKSWVGGRIWLSYSCDQQEVLHFMIALGLYNRIWSIKELSRTSPFYSCTIIKLIQMEYQVHTFFLHSTNSIWMIDPYQVNVACMTRF